MTDTIIEVENLSKRYVLDHQQDREQYTALRDVIANGVKSVFKGLRGGKTETKEEFWALKDVSFEVKRGEVVGIIGRNGAGKSTLLKILSRITEPTTGRVRLKGRVASLLEVGTGFHPELTGRENIYLNGAVLGMMREEIDRKFDEIVAFAEVEKFLDTPVKRYSSGMYVRLAFAVAAHLEPEILVVDEVLAVGDAAFQKKCLGKMGDVASKEGRTVLFVSHNMDIIRRLCHSGILLKKGKIDFCGDVNTGIYRYLQEDIETKASYKLKPPSDLSIGVHAYKLTVEDHEGNTATLIPVGKPWQVRINLKIFKPINSLVVGLGFTTDLGVPYRTVWTKPQTLEAGEYQIIFREDQLILAPGNYSITVGLSVYNTTFQYQENAGILSIADFSDGIGEDNLQCLSGTGIVLNAMNVHIFDSIPNNN
jgi:lipopolysaccharide transport system ATP-binding protein